MKFNKLRLVGFKSFVEPSEFVIEPGLTGIVGPNGCGKSNLVEALRWVMGENSYKNMRASGMDDVIFSGSGNRPARNSAEVGLFLDNSDRTAPAAFNDSDEIQVSRRIEREQGSVYKINGKEARARDVQLLFADASTGARSPSMVGQGRIGELIQAKPQARRQLLEEAAGISGLHSRRHEAELRLRAAETNLERLDDVTAQLDSQIESLKRQARQANRFKMLSADIRALEARLLHIRWVDAKTQEAEADSALNQATIVVAERANEQMEAAKTQAIAAMKLPDLRNDEAARAAALQRLQIARGQLDEEAARILRRRDELTRRIAQLDTDILRETGLVADNAGIIERLDAEEEELNDLLADANGLMEDARLAMDEAARVLGASENRFAAITAERAEALALRLQLERLIRDTAERRNRLDRQREDARRDLATLDAQLADLAPSEDFRIAVEDAMQAIADGEIRIEDLDAMLAEARETEQGARNRVEAARTQLNGLETEARTIIRIIEAGAAHGDFQPVSEQIEVDRGFETALGAVLGEDLDSATDPSAPSYWSDAGDRSGDPALPAGVKPLGVHVRGAPQLDRRLAQTGIVEPADGLRLMAELRPGQRLVSREGAVWRWDGHVSRADSPSSAALRMQQKNRLAEIEQEILAARTSHQAVEAGHRSAQQALANLERDLAAARDEQRLRARQLADAQAELARAERAAGDILRRKAVVEELMSGLDAQLAELAITDEDARIALDDAPDTAGLDLALANQGAAVATDRALLAEARARHDGELREIEARRRRLLAISTERQSWTMRADSARAQIAALQARKDEAGDELEGLAEAPDELDDKRIRLMNEITRAEKERRDSADRLAQAETLSREADQKAVAAQAALADSREKRGRAEERLMAARQWRIEAEARIRDKLNVSPHEAVRLAGLKHDDPLGDPRQLEIDLDRLRVERERLGAVNLRAEDEQKELSEKLDKLTGEREDVIEAIKRLRTAIQSLNREGRERLLQAFEAVNEHFRRLFTHLFNGGEAELQLIESDDPLEAGLEILARPPGKKPQTMTLLSGGEQALTAMALIFAVFLTNPAPICVLDEVDAPLDDHNVERYCNLMDQMADETDTRFVIITHNPITMARMNRLFGVTMAEQGVSQLVSVDLQTAEALREAV